MVSQFINHYVVYSNYTDSLGGMRIMWTKDFWRDLAERAISTALQVILGLIAVDGFSLATVDFAAAATAVGVAVFAVFAKSIIAATKTEDSISPASFAKKEEK